MAIKIIAFDADDTLWHNESYFQEAENRFKDLLEDYLPQHTVGRELLRTEMDNLPWYGYGVKAFILSMIETAIRITDGNLKSRDIETIIGFGKELLAKPVVMLDGVEKVLANLAQKYRLVLATKGDLLDQERKLYKSSLAGYFHHIEIMSEKREADFQKLIRHLDVAPAEFAMIGNSLKSDVMPVLQLGGHAYHIPYHVTWDLEKVDHHIEHENFRQVEKISQLLEYL
ncbi:MAG: HAD family hydrolase [Cyclobacteriaceae bacterium]|nr:HAD family hydrolase [Cyclobacteriaceae bacterium]